MSPPSAPVVANELDVRLDTAGAQYVSYSATSGSIIVAHGPQATRYPLQPGSQPEVPCASMLGSYWATVRMEGDVPTSALNTVHLLWKAMCPPWR